jgi:acyl carrier protein
MASKQDRIRKIVGEVAKKDRLPGEDESLFEAGVLDSFALADLVAALEAEFRVSVPDTDMRPRNFETLARIDSYLERIGA